MMQERFDNPQFYSYVFFPRNAKRVAMIFLAMIPLQIVATFFVGYINPQFSLHWKWLAVAAAIELAFTIPLIFYFIRLSKKIIVGVNQGGLYLRSVGFITWAEIKELEKSQFEDRPAIKIILLRPVDGSEQISVIKSSKHTVTTGFGSNPDEKFILDGLSISLHDLLLLLQDYHLKYQQEVWSFAPEQSQSSAEMASQSLVINVPVNKKVPSWLVRAGIVVLFVLGFAGIALVKHDKIYFFFFLGLAAFTAPFYIIGDLKAVKKMLQVLFIIITSGLAATFIVLFVYELIMKSHLDLNALGSAAACVSLLAFEVLRDWQISQRKERVFTLLLLVPLVGFIVGGIGVFIFELVAYVRVSYVALASIAGSAVLLFFSVLFLRKLKNDREQHNQP